MTNDDSSDNKPTGKPARIILASRSMNGVSLGEVEILASTKHGPTELIGVKPPATLEAGEELVTDTWILSSRNFIVVGPHDRAMKLPGTWYVVRGSKR